MCGVAGNCDHEKGGSGPSNALPRVGPFTASAVLDAHIEAIDALPSRQPSGDPARSPREQMAFQGELFAYWWGSGVGVGR